MENIYNVICLLWMICYISLLTNIFTVDTMMTLDAAKWNGTGGELSPCVINT